MFTINLFETVKEVVFIFRKYSTCLPKLQFYGVKIFIYTHPTPSSCNV